MTSLEHTQTGLEIGESKRFPSVHWPLLVVMILLVVFGTVVQYSACSQTTEKSFARVILGLVAGFICFVILWRFDYRKFERYSWVLMAIALLLIVMPRFPIIGVYTNGAYSWVKFGPISFQPSEISKVLSILYMASMVSRYSGSINTWKDFFKVSFLLVLPFICIMVQPDLGTGLVFLVMAFMIIFTGGAKAKFLGITTVVLVALAALVLITDNYIDENYGDESSIIKDYQMSRLTVFLDETVDPDGVGYNLHQSKVAIGSGGLTGKGLGNSTQAAGGFLPEYYTDFIFAFLCEELGFVGGIALLLLYFLLLLYGYLIAAQSSDLFGKLIIAGCLGMWAFQVIENVGMTMGLMPVTGIPLPFMSYGSTALVTNFACLGLVFSVWARRQGVGEKEKLFSSDSRRKVK